MKINPYHYSDLLSYQNRIKKCKEQLEYKHEDLIHITLVKSCFRLDSPIRIRLLSNLIRGNTQNIKVKLEINLIGEYAVQNDEICEFKELFKHIPSHSSLTISIDQSNNMSDWGILAGLYQIEFTSIQFFMHHVSRTSLQVFQNQFPSQKISVTSSIQIHLISDDFPEELSALINPPPHYKITIPQTHNFSFNNLNQQFQIFPRNTCLSSLTIECDLNSTDTILIKALSKEISRISQINSIQITQKSIQTLSREFLPKTERLNTHCNLESLQIFFNSILNTRLTYLSIELDQLNSIQISSFAQSLTSQLTSLDTLSITIISSKSIFNSPSQAAIENMEEEDISYPNCAKNKDDDNQIEIKNMVLSFEVDLNTSIISSDSIKLYLIKLLSRNIRLFQVVDIPASMLNELFMTISRIQLLKQLSISIRKQQNTNSFWSDEMFNLLSTTNFGTLVCRISQHSQSFFYAFVKHLPQTTSGLFLEFDTDVEQINEGFFSLSSPACISLNLSNPISNNDKMLIFLNSAIRFYQNKAELPRNGRHTLFTELFATNKATLLSIIAMSKFSIFFNPIQKQYPYINLS